MRNLPPKFVKCFKSPCIEEILRKEYGEEYGKTEEDRIWGRI
jgi:hypothetical protein